ncbi:MAG: GAF domain-containing protein, partial [Candidatus Omnitrophica bacterium]|nr:GAF domain-containing protein [Candidatus Omnitrophota bacterium]
LCAIFLLRIPKQRLNAIWAVVCIAVSIWGVGSYKFSTAQTKEVAFFWWQIAHIGTIFVPVFYYHFVHSYLKLNKIYQKHLLIVVYLLGVFFLVCTFYPKKIFIGELRLIFNQYYSHDWTIKKNILYLLFYISFYWILLMYSFCLILNRYLHSSGLIKNQLKYFFVAMIVGWFGPHGDYLPVFGIYIYPYSNFLMTFYTIIIAYAIFKYRLLDVRVAITRAGLFIAVYTLVLGVPFAIANLYKQTLVDWLGANWWMLPLSLMAGLATIGPFIYIYLDRKAEEALLREQKRYQNTLKQASVGMTRIRNLKRLLELIAHIVTKTVKISYVAIYIYDKDNDEYVLQVNRDKGRIPIARLSSSNILLDFLFRKREPIIYEEIKRLSEDSTNPIYKSIEENMAQLTASVIIPSLLERKPMGFIVLGDKMSGQIYTPDDLNVFQVLASQAALAIENAKFIEEAKEMQAQIAHAEKMATVGTMADGLSHQINNRFYALSLIAGDALDSLKITDTTKCTPEVQQMLQDINHALERIEVNVMKGGEVVKGILKYTRKEKEVFESLILDEIIDGTLDMVQYKVKLSDIDIIRSYRKDIPGIQGNLVQLQEVFFNFIDNANDAMAERKTTLKEPGYRGKITISAIDENNSLQVIIQDNGMGIKKQDTKKIFTPFFTTKISSRKGTGLGLYVINKIITENHHGKILFESEHMAGTRFIIELPIAQPPAAQ